MIVLLIFSCKNEKEVTESITKKTAYYCLTNEIEEIEITGSLTLDSKGNALVDFNDSIFNGKIRIVGEASYQSIYENYDAYLSIKNVNDTECKISVYGHYTLPVDSTNWAHDRRDFHAHQISFGF